MGGNHRDRDALINGKKALDKAIKVDFLNVSIALLFHISFRRQLLKGNMTL